MTDPIKLTGLKRINVQKFKNKVLVSIREFYKDNDQEKPGKKGIALSIDDWKLLKDNISAIDNEIQKLTE